MGKFLKGIALLAASAVGTYYYKNPKELEKHKDILKENIEVTSICTVKENDKFFSYRLDNQTAKRIGTLIQID